MERSILLAPTFSGLRKTTFAHQFFSINFFQQYSNDDLYLNLFYNLFGELSENFLSYHFNILSGKFSETFSATISTFFKETFPKIFSAMITALFPTIFLRTFLATYS